MKGLPEIICVTPSATFCLALDTTTNIGNRIVEYGHFTGVRNTWVQSWLAARIISYTEHIMHRIQGQLGRTLN